MEKTFYCYHCNKKVGKTLYYQHKKKYYSPSTNIWQRETQDNQADEEFHFSDVESPDLGLREEFEFEDNTDSLTGDSPQNDEDAYGNTVFSEDSDDEVEDPMTEVWLEDTNIDNFDDDDGSQTAGVESRTMQIVRFYVMFLLMWQSIFKLSDSGMTVLFLYLFMLLSLLLSSVTIPSIQNFIALLPKNTSAARKLIGNVSDPFIKFVSCPQCHSLYSVHLCKIVNPDKTVSSRLCSHIKFPHHPHHRQRLPCNTPLMKTVKTSIGSTYLYPRQMFCYQSIIEALRQKLQTPGFFEKTEHWRKRRIHASTLSDIYDGRVWNNFLCPDNIPFLSAPYNFALALNIDWFQPFKYSNYSLGAMYVAIQNLPRHERYSNDNAILLGVIPGPNEPKKDCNTYLKPFVNELKELWDGVVMNNATGMQVFVRAALICVACDIPASRKVSGFVGHNALRACSRCLKTFPTKSFGEKADFTGTDRTTWTHRSLDTHKCFARKHRDSKTKAEQKAIEREHGCRYSILLELPYFNVIQNTVVDPMHNLLLGTAKHMLSVWVSMGLIGKSHFEVIQEVVDSFVTPSDVGRIPSKITSGFSGFTAEQWRNWTLIYSLCSLKGILPHRHYDCWLLFVKAVSILCQRQITFQEVERGDNFLMEFCKSFESLYGKENYTINLHLHGHLKECILDFGPVYSFWLFSYERMNGILGSFHTNGHDLSLQIMRRYMSCQGVSVAHWPSEFKHQFAPLLFRHCFQEGSLKACSLALAVTECNTSNIELIPPVTETAWQSAEKEQLASLMTSFIGHNEYTLLLLHLNAPAIVIGGFILGSTSSRHTTKSHVMAVHPQFPEELYLTKIDHFCRVDFRDNLGNNSHSHWIACVTFYEPHICKVWFGGPTQVWCKSAITQTHYIKLSSIKSRVAYCEREVDFGNHIGKQDVLVVSVFSDYSS